MIPITLRVKVFYELEKLVKNITDIGFKNIGILHNTFYLKLHRAFKTTYWVVKAFEFS